jgi:hypothetical protein
MRRPHFLISAAWLFQGAAWFLPVVTSVLGGSINPITGWGAFLLSSTAFWPRTDTVFGTWYETVLATGSVVTTVLFIFGSPWVAVRGSRSARRVSAWVAVAAFVLNSHWYVLLRPDGFVSRLGIGYFLWSFSFVLLAIGLFDLAYENHGAEFTHSRAALLPR